MGSGNSKLVVENKELRTDKEALKGKVDELVKQLHSQFGQFQKAFQDHVKSVKEEKDQVEKYLKEKVQEQVKEQVEAIKKKVSHTCQREQTVPQENPPKRQKLERRIHRQEITVLARLFDSPEFYLNAMGLCLADQTDVRNAAKDSTALGMMKCLNLWHQRNPSEATFGNLIKILKDLGKEEIAKKVQHQFVGNSD